MLLNTLLNFYVLLMVLSNALLYFYMLISAFMVLLVLSSAFGALATSKYFQVLLVL